MGTSANPTAAGDSAGNPPAGGQPNGGEGNPGGGSGASAGSPAGAAPSLNRSALNPLLRGLDEGQINDVFETLLRNAREGNAGGGNGETARQPAAPPPPTRDELRDAFDPSSDKFDPEKAITLLVQKNYGGLINDIGRNSLVGMTAALKSSLPDIDDYQQEMAAVLRNKAPQSISQEDLLAAYYMAKGAVQTKKEIEARNKPATTITPSPAEDKEKLEKEKLSPVEEDMARIMFRGSKDPVADYKRGLKLVDGDFEIRIPGDAPREPAKK